MNIRLTLLLLFFSFKAFTQGIFQDLSFADAQQQARQNGKLIFLQFESPTCKPCNELANQTFTAKNLSERIQQTFILLKIPSNHSDRKRLAKEYNIVNGFGSFIIDQNGILIKRLNYSSSSTKEYENWLDAALIEAGENLNISAMEQMYQDGNKHPAFLERYLIKKKELDLPYDALLEDYAQSLPADSLQSTRTLQFILQMEPSVNSLAYQILTHNKPLFLKTWYEMKPPLRNTIKRDMIMKSLAAAIQKKEVTDANNIVTFIMDTEDKDLPHLETLRSCDQVMLFFHKNSGNFNLYAKDLVTYFNTYYMNRSLDELRKADALIRSRRFVRSVLPQTPSAKPKATPPAGKTTIIRDTMRTRSVSVNSLHGLDFGYVDDLNQAAISFSRLPKNSELLHKAISWIQLSLSIHETATAYCAYARLLYRLDQKEKAIEMQTKAINLLSKFGFAYEHYIILLEKMKQGVPDLDRSTSVDKLQ